MDELKEWRETSVYYEDLEYATLYPTMQTEGVEEFGDRSCYAVGVGGWSNQTPSRAARPGVLLASERACIYHV